VLKHLPFQPTVAQPDARHERWQFVLCEQVPNQRIELNTSACMARRLPGFDWAAPPTSVVNQSMDRLGHRLGIFGIWNGRGFQQQRTGSNNTQANLKASWAKYHRHGQHGADRLINVKSPMIAGGHR
jgi:hypothetical protein